MAQSTGKKTNQKKSGTTRASGSARSSAPKTRVTRKSYQDDEVDVALFNEIGIIIFSIVMLILFLCNFGIIGVVGNYISYFMFGIFGLSAYAAPVLLFFATIFYYANLGKASAIRKLICAVMLYILISVVFALIDGDILSMEGYSLSALYQNSAVKKAGGGIIAGTIGYGMCKAFGLVGSVLLIILLSIVSFILMTGKSMLKSVKSGLDTANTKYQAGQERRREQQYMREQERLEHQERQEQLPQCKQDAQGQLAIADEKNKRRDRKVSGVMLDTRLKAPEKSKSQDMHEIILENTQDFNHQVYEEYTQGEKASSYSPKSAMGAGQAGAQQPKAAAPAQVPVHKEMLSQIRVHSAEARKAEQSQSGTAVTKPSEASAEPIVKPVTNLDKKPKTYMFPPLSRLQKGDDTAGDSSQELKETALRLQQTLNTFGVKVTITDISQGPTVTRYELQPEQGVKVSKIVGLQDDIKLNLAATDIRIEAPIPGKAAIGIEVPNKKNIGVTLRSLLESKEFREFNSNIAFAVGKDIAGQVVISDIAKMPHMLIAGSTGSGKSVCINAIIMSILYKAHPDDVKLIMVDPKVVELSVYNGIPHLLIPVVNDPKKASAALHWAVSEMEDRYRKFAELNVRDLKGYNQKLETMRQSGDDSVPAKLPQIVIIIDELADLMMVCPGEVEESICRLAQLARACGIHLIIATQRPSVDVITGLIKANMPSRAAFALKSGVDSRTILDMVGAEKLLGNGDMLFFPQGYSKPARIQGAFVSDKEVSDVVDFLKNQMLGNTYAEDVEEKIQSLGTGTAASAGGSAGAQESGRDDLFVQAGKFIIDKDKASIGMLQRVFKIGFNRAARIMDQLCEYGVVGEEEGTKPRKILMSMEQFEQLIDEI